MTLGLMKRTLLTILLLVPAPASNADSGERFLSVACSASSLTVEPFIAWNEGVLKYSEAQQKGKSKDGDTTIFYFSKRYSDTARTSCTVKGVTFRIVVSQGELEIVDGRRALMRKTIDDVWDFYGPVYKVRYTRNEWTEYCGHVERGPTWKPAEFEVSNTNCR